MGPSFHSTLLAIGVFLFFSGCSLSPSKLPPRFPEDTSRLTHWQATGKVGIRYKGQSKSAYLDWKNHGEDFNLQVNGILGFGKVKVETKGSRVEMFHKDQHLVAESAEELVRHAIGVTLPVNGLQYWLTGRPLPHAPLEKQQISDRGTTEQLSQQGWEITYKSYQQVDQLTLPRKITAKRQDLIVTIVIKSWKPL